MSSAKTIRLQNLTMTNLSVMLHELVPASRGSMRRGPALTPILIKNGSYYDVCEKHRCTLQEARDLIARSPEVQSLIRLARILVVEYPPEAPPAPEPAVTEPVAPEPTVTAEALVVEDAIESIEVTDADLELPAVDGQVAPAAAVPDDAPAGDPSMDWSEADLRAYAAAKGIDVTRAKSKTAVLRAIRSAK